MHFCFTAINAMKAINILLVEDNQGDVVLIMEALEAGRIHNVVTVLRDGQEAVEYLTKSGIYSKSPFPDLILLDINLPKVDGKEVLSFIKNDPKLKRIPVVMLTTSSSEKDVLDSYESHANCYITKPVDVNKFFEAVKSIEDFWISVVKLPSRI